MHQGITLEKKKNSHTGQSEKPHRSITVGKPSILSKISVVLLSVDQTQEQMKLIFSVGID